MFSTLENIAERKSFYQIKTAMTGLVETKAYIVEENPILKKSKLSKD